MADQALKDAILNGNAAFDTYEQLIRSNGGSLQTRGFLVGQHYIAQIGKLVQRIDDFEQLKPWFIANVFEYQPGTTGEEQDSVPDQVHCPVCKSTQLHAGQRGYDFWKGGIFGSGQVVITCLRCGNKFQPGSSIAPQG